MTVHGDPQDAAATQADPGVDSASAPGEGPVDDRPPVDDPAVAAAEALEAAQRERDEYLDALQRMKAEFDNYRKRMDRDRVQLRAGGVRDVVMEVLPVLDNLERAVEALTRQDAALADGVDMVRGQLTAVLGGHGLVEVPARGETFDPTLHEAVAVVPDARHAEGVVIEVVQKGYRAGDDLVRAAKVVVSAGTPAEPAG